MGSHGACPRLFHAPIDAARLRKNEPALDLAARRYPSYRPFREGQRCPQKPAQKPELTDAGGLPPRRPPPQLGHQLLDGSLLKEIRARALLSANGAAELHHHEPGVDRL